MKKIFIYMLLFATTSAFAQDAGGSFKSKNGHEVLPQAGEWSIGVNATSFLTYIGSAFSGRTTANTAPVMNYTDGPNNNVFGNLGGMSFTGKYMASANTAYRARVQVAYLSTTNKGFSLKSEVVPNPLLPEYVEDQQNIGQTTILIGGGIEKRRGSGRLQGIYGGELLLGYMSASADYTYGNAMDANFPAPATTGFGTLTGGGFRPLEEKIDNRFLFGARGFIGVEYFVAPKISIGGEIGYTIGFQTWGSAYRVNEVFDNGSLKPVNVETKLTTSGQLRSWGLGLDNLNSGLNLNFYF